MHPSAPAHFVAFRRSAAIIFAPIAIAICLLIAGRAAAVERQLAPGVLTTIAPSFAPEDTVSTHDVMELRKNPAIEWKPEFFSTPDTLSGMVGDTKFRREIYCLEFAFKPLRMIEVDVPNANGTTDRRLVWYMVYRVRNTGQTLKPVEGDNGVYSTQPGKGGPVRFFPQFVLESQDRQSAGPRVSKSYLDRVIPAADVAINARERIGRPLLNSVEISKQPIPVSDGRIDHSVWGVATWVDVDPRMDFFSVYVGGLTNAYRWTDSPAAYKVGDPPGRGRRFDHKTLQLNFWRPGDDLELSEREFRYGVPLDKARLYDVGDGVAYRWVYR